MAVEDPVEASHPRKGSWWRRKRILIPALLFVILAIFGIVFGAVYGVKKSDSEDEQNERDQLLAAQAGTLTPLSNSTYHTATASPSYVVITTGTVVYATKTVGSTPRPTSSSTSTPEPELPESSGPLLQAEGPVPRDISAAVQAPGLIVWDLRPEGKLWRKEHGSSWDAYTDRRFLVAPITVRTSDNTQTAFSVEAVHGRIVYMHFHDGSWGDWQELEFAAQFRRRPSVVTRGQGKIDVFNVDNDGHVWIVLYDGSSWGEWTELGADITSEVAATSWGEDRIDLFAKKGNTVLHKRWSSESGWAGEWEDLGDPFPTGGVAETGPSSPLVASWRDGNDGVIDVVINSGSSSHKQFMNGAWTDWIGMYASHEGYEFPDTQSIVKAGSADGPPFAHLISRGTDNCIHYNAHNGTGWGFWKYVWCEKGNGLDYPTQFLPTFITTGTEGKVELLARDLERRFLRLEIQSTGPDEWVYTTSNDKWEDLGQPT